MWGGVSVRVVSYDNRRIPAEIPYTKIITTTYVTMTSEQNEGNNNIDT